MSEADQLLGGVALGAVLFVVVWVFSVCVRFLWDVGVYLFRGN